MPEGLPKDEFVALTKKFDGWKRRNEKIDFDDMLTECYDVLSQDEKTRKMWQDRFDYILVDEFRDVKSCSVRLPANVSSTEKQSVRGGG